MSAWPSRSSVVVLIAIVGLGMALPVPFVATIPATVVLVAVLARIRDARPEQARAGIRIVLALLALETTVCAMLFVLVMRSGTYAALAALTTALGVVATRVPRLVWAYLVALGATLAAAVATFAQPIDVKPILTDSIGAVLHGRNPYALTFANPYSAADTVRYYAPEFVSGDRINVGYPYLPTPLLVELPGYLLGELRWVGIAALLTVLAVGWSLATDPLGRLLVVALGASPLTLVTITSYWVEPVLALGVAVLAWSLVHRRAWAMASAVAVLLTVKQYAVIWLPLERAVRLRVGWRPLAMGVAIAAGVLLPFVAADPGAFWRAAVLLQLHQPFRSDSRSLLIDVVGGTGEPHPLLLTGLSVLSLVTGVAVAWWVRKRARGEVTWTILGIGLSLLATTLLSKQGHANYYFLVLVALVVGAVTWPRDLSSA